MRSSKYNLRSGDISRKGSTPSQAEDINCVIQGSRRVVTGRKSSEISIEQVILKKRKKKASKPKLLPESVQPDNEYQARLRDKGKKNVEPPRASESRKAKPQGDLKDGKKQKSIQPKEQIKKESKFRGAKDPPKVEPKSKKKTKKVTAVKDHEGSGNVSRESLESVRVTPCGSPQQLSSPLNPSNVTPDRKQPMRIPSAPRKANPIRFEFSDSNVESSYTRHPILDSSSDDEDINLDHEDTYNDPLAMIQRGRIKEVGPDDQISSIKSFLFSPEQPIKINELIHIWPKRPPSWVSSTDEECLVQVQTENDTKVPNFLEIFGIDKPGN